MLFVGYIYDRFLWMSDILYGVMSNGLGGDYVVKVCF